MREGGDTQTLVCSDKNLTTLHLILQQCERYKLPIINMFLDFVAAFDSVTRQNLWRIMLEDGMPVEFIELLKAYYKHCKSTVRVLGEETEPFNVESGVKQGCILSPVLFNYCIDWILESALSSFDGVVMGLGINVSDLDYADDINALAADPATAQAMLNEIAHFSQLLGMKINTAKTKVMDLNIQSDYQLVLYGQELEKVDSFTYLGSIIDSRGGCDLDIQNRINKAQAIFSQLRRHLWIRREISMKTKLSVYKAAGRSVLFYAVETWPLKALHLHDLEVFDHRCLRKILRIRYSDRISNVDVRHRCCNIEPAAMIVKQRRLRWLGHVLRRPNDRIIKQVLLAVPLPDWRRRPGGQFKNWWTTAKNDLDPIGGFRKFGRKWESCWLRFAEELAQDRDKWESIIRSLLDAG